VEGLQGQQMNTRIPQNLDEPERYFIFTLDELIVSVGPIVVLMITVNFVVGLAVGASAFWLLRKIKKGGNLNRLLWHAYWLMPSEVFSLKQMPASDERMLVG
jgi:conjugal transfer pilus assembly protein TraL